MKKKWLTLEQLETRYAPATLTVTTKLDVVDANDGKLSLREAITQANGTAEADTIRLRKSGVYLIALAGDFEDANATGDFDILNPVTIQGKNATKTIIDAGSLDRVFHVKPSASFAVTFTKLTIRHGFIGDVGGGIFVDDNSAPVNLTVSKSVVTENFGNNRGGGISSQSGLMTITDCTISNNLSNSTGSGINVDGDGPATITRCTITGNSGPSQGGGIATTDSGSLLTINDSLISNNGSGGGGGGGIDVSGDVVLNNTVVRNNVSGTEGGGLSADGDATINQCSFLGNTSFKEGGGIFGETGSNITVNGSHIVDNRSFFGSAPGHGGGIASHGLLNISQSTVAGNVAGNDGGGIYSEGTRVVIDNCTISDNRSIEGKGGGLALRTTGTGASGSTLTNTTVSGNFNLSDGGGIFVRTGALTLTNSTVSDNRSGGGNGGGVAAVDSELTLINSAVSGNRGGEGGGVAIDGGVLTLTDSTLSGNFSQFDGGGLSTLDGAQTTLTRSTVSGNQCSGFGGGVSANGSNLTVIDSTISGNVSAGVGGGIRADGPVLTISGSTISGNTADEDGGGIAVRQGVDAATLTNVTISANTAQSDGGGLHINMGAAADPVQLLNVTITGNLAQNGGGLFHQTGTISVKNTLIAKNQVTTGVGPDVNGIFVSQGHNLIGIGDGSTSFVNGFAGNQVGSAAAPTNPTLSPLQDNGGPTLTHALLAGSPAIDAGNNNGAPVTDQRGIARPKDGDGNLSPVVDIGAFEM